MEPNVIHCINIPSYQPDTGFWYARKRIHYKFGYRPYAFGLGLAGRPFINTLVPSSTRSTVSYIHIQCGSVCLQNEEGIAHGGPHQ